MMRFKTIIMSGFMAGAAAVATVAPFAAPAHAEVIEQEDNYFVTRDARVVETDAYETWAALIAPNRWWSDSHTWSGDAENMYLSAQAGGCFCELLPEREAAPDGVRRGSARHMEVLQANPPLVLRMRGGLGPLQSEPVDGVLTITVKPVDGGTRVLFEYIVGGAMRFDVPVIAKSVDGVMSEQLAGLAKLLGEVEGAEVDEAKDEDASEDDGDADIDTESEDDSDAEESSDKSASSDSDDEDDDEEASNDENTDSEEADEEAEVASDDSVETVRDPAMGEPDTARIVPTRVLTLEEAIDRMSGQDSGDE